MAREFEALVDDLVEAAEAVLVRGRSEEDWPERCAALDKAVRAVKNAHGSGTANLTEEHIDMIALRTVTAPRTRPAVREAFLAVVGLDRCADPLDALHDAQHVLSGVRAWARESLQKKAG